MTCRCGEAMRLRCAWDDAQETDHAYNLYACDECGAVAHESVWKDPGVTWVFVDGTVARGRDIPERPGRP